MIHMVSLTQWTWVWVSLGIGDGQGGLMCCDSWGCRVGHDWATELNWTELNWWYKGLPWWLRGKKPACQCRRHETWVRSLSPESGRSPGGGHGNPLLYSCLENPMNREAWWVTVHGITKSRTLLKWLSRYSHMTVLEQLWKYWWLVLIDQLPFSLWTKSSSDVGKIHNASHIKIQIDYSKPLFRINQYPVS